MSDEIEFKLTVEAVREHALSRGNPSDEQIAAAIAEVRTEEHYRNILARVQWAFDDLCTNVWVHARDLAEDDNMNGNSRRRPT